MAAWLCVLLAGGLAAGAEADESGVVGTRGPVTNLPLPRFVSMKAAEGNSRRGPSLSHRVDWVYKRADLPLQIVAEFGNWRRVRDWEGAEGWMHYSLLSGVRTVMITRDRTALHDSPNPASPVSAYVEQGVVARLMACVADWCRVRTGGYKGWVVKADVWGVGAKELRE